MDLRARAMPKTARTIPIAGRLCAAVVLLGLGACAGRTDSNSSSPNGNYTIGGSVAGLVGTGLVLRNNGGNDLAINQNGSFTFTNSQPSSSLYNVTVASQPNNPSQTCSVARGVDGVTGGNVTNISVTCTTNSYTVSGTVTGLVGSGLVLQNNGGNSIAVPQNSAFTFSTSILSGGSYAVTVGTQPSQPKQTCNVANGNGTITNNNIINIAIICTTNAYLVGGLVTGLAGDGLILQNNGGNDLAVLQDGPFSFLIPLLSGESYAVTTLKQPINLSQTCTVLNGTGTIGVASINTIAVSCVTNKFSVGGTVTGLAPGVSVVLQNNGGDTLTVSSNGTVTFPKMLMSGAAFDVRVVRQPANPNQVCEVTNGTGTVSNTAVTAPTIDCFTQHPRFAFSLDYNSQSVSTYAIDESTGQLRRRGFSNVGLRPIQIARDASQKFLFVLNRGSATVSAFVHNSVTGENSEVSGSPYPTGAVANNLTSVDDGANGLTIHPNKGFLYVANGSGAAANNIAGFTIDAVSGALTPMPGSPFATGARPFALSVDAQGKFLYSLNTGSNNIYVFSIDQTTGALSEVPNSRAATGTLGVSGLFVLHPNGKFGFVGNAGSNNISVYSVNTDTGVLTNVPGSPFGAGVSPGTGIWLHPNGHFLYLRNAGTTDVNNGSVSGYAFNDTTGVLTEVSGSPFATGVNSLYSWMDPARRFLYIVNRGPTTLTGAASQGSISMFRLDNTTGALIPVSGSPLSVQPAPFSLNVDPSGRFAYVASVQGNFGYAYSIDQSTGALAPLTQGAKIVTRSQPISLDPQAEKLTPQSPVFKSKFAFVANSSDGSLYSFAIDGTTGTLSPAISVPSAGTSPTGTIVSPNGKYLYASDAVAAQGISSYTIDANTGVLSTNTSNLNTVDGLNMVRIDPNGRTVYVNSPNPVTAPTAFQRAFSVAPLTGQLSVLSGNNTSNSVTTATDLAVAPTGLFFYFITDSTIGFSPIVQTTGEFGGSPVAASGAPAKSAIAIDPTNRFAYVALSSAPGAIEVRTISPYNGSLSSVVQTIPTGSNPKAMTIDPTGRFLYVANSGSDNLSTFSIDPNDGTLSELLPRVAAGTNPTAISADYSGKYVYVLSANTQRVLAYNVDPTTGALMANLLSATTGNGPVGLSLSTNIQ